MRKILVVLVAFGCVSLVATAAHAQCGVLNAQCLVNGNLDIGTAGAASDPGTAPPWTLTNTGNTTAAQFQPGFADDTGVNGIWYRAFLGSVATPVSADLSQTAVTTTAGVHVLNFHYLIETNFTADSMVATLSSTSGGTATLDLLTQPRTAAGGGFSANPPSIGTLSINANAGDTLTVHLNMVNGRVGPANPQSVVADSFSLVRVPEPASAALVLVGILGLFGFARRR